MPRLRDRLRDVTGGPVASSGRDPDLLGFQSGAGLTPTTDLERLEVINPNEGATLDRRLNTQLRGIENTVNRVGEDAAVAKAGTNADTRSRLDAAQFERATRGMDLSPRQKKAAGRRLGLARSLNRASATGATRRGFTDRSKSAASIGGGFADAIFGQRLGAETGLAAAAVTKHASEEQKKADKKSGFISAVANIAGSVLAFFSSEELKTNLGHEPQLLEKLKKVRVNRWQYKGDNEIHVGPFSEEFNREFGIKTDRPDMINVIDALGVTLGAVKELDKKVSANGRH